MGNLTSKYEAKAQKFLENTGTEFAAVFLYTGKHFEDDKEPRDIYGIEFKRKGRVWTFKFGQSIAHSRPEMEKFVKDLDRRGYAPYSKEVLAAKKLAQPPSAYDVLSCITKLDPGTFEDFCQDFGYDTDSKRAEKTYFADQKEYSECRKMFGDVMDALCEIQ